MDSLEFHRTRYSDQFVFDELRLRCGHADAFATSIALYLRPESVRVGRISAPENEAVAWEDPKLDFSRYSATGVIGDPTEATAELGARLWEAVVESVVETFRNIAEAPLE